MSRILKLTSILSDAESGEILEKAEALISEEYLNNIHNLPEYSVADCKEDIIANEEIKLVGYENYFGLKNTGIPIKTHEQHLEEYCTPKLNTEPAEADVIVEEFK